MADDPTIEEQILSDLASQAKDAAVSWVLNKVGLGGDPSDMTAQLQKLAAAIAKVQATLDNFIAIYLTTEAFDALRNIVIVPAATVIDTNYDQMSGLHQGDADIAKSLATTDQEIQYGNQRDMLDRAFRGAVTGVDGELMELAVDRILARIMGPGYSVMNAVPLMKAYRDLEAFFHGMITVQIKGGVLRANAANYHNHHDRAVLQAAELNANLANHALRFLTAVERLTATYSPDVSFLHTIEDPSTDPIGAAQQIVQIIPGAKGSRAWFWSGTGIGYNLSNGVPFPAALTIARNASPVVPVSASQEWRADNPRPLGRDGDFWTTARYCFPPTLTAGEYWPAPAASFPANATVYAAIPSYPLRSPLSASLHHFLDPSGPKTTYVSVSSLSLSNGTAGIGNIRNFSDTSFTIEVWVMPQSPGTIFSVDRSLLLLNADGSVTLQNYYSGQPGLTAAQYPWDFWNNRWHQVALSCDYGSSQSTLYVDGRNPFVFDSGNLGMTFVNLGAMAIGSAVAGQPPQIISPISANYNEFRVWLRARSNEIAGDVNAVIWSGDALVCAYGLDQGNLNDRSGQHGPLEVNATSSFVFVPSGAGGMPPNPLP